MPGPLPAAVVEQLSLPALTGRHCAVAEPAPQISDMPAEWHVALPARIEGGRRPTIGQTQLVARGGDGRAGGRQLCGPGQVCTGALLT